MQPGLLLIVCLLTQDNGKKYAYDLKSVIVCRRWYLKGLLAAYVYMLCYTLMAIIFEVKRDKLDILSQNVPERKEGETAKDLSSQ